MTPLASAFYDIACEEGSTASIEEIRNLAFQKIQSGEVKSLISTSVNGSSFNYNLSLPADKLFAETSLAIRLFNQGQLRVTQVDFSQI